jgi:hypothetical protein
MDIAGQDADGRRWLPAVLASPDPLEEGAEPVERLPERRPMLQVDRSPMFDAR